MRVAFWWFSLQTWDFRSTESLAFTFHNGQYLERQLTLSISALILSTVSHNQKSHRLCSTGRMHNVMEYHGSFAGWCQEKYFFLTCDLDACQKEALSHLLELDDNSEGFNWHFCSDSAYNWHLCLIFNVFILYTDIINLYNLMCQIISVLSFAFISGSWVENMIDWLIYLHSGSISFVTVHLCSSSLFSGLFNHEVTVNGVINTTHIFHFQGAQGVLLTAFHEAVQ